MKPLTEQHLAIFRRHMVEIVDMHFDLASDEIGKDALDPELRRALMLDLLGVSAGQRVLEVGTGLGYQAAVMAEIGAEVFSVEVVEEFAEAAKARLAALGYFVEIRAGDGSRGWAEHAPYDAILVTAAAPEPPQKLLDQLKPGGRMVAPLGDSEVQQLSVVEKAADGTPEVRSLMPVRFTQLELTG